MTPSLFEPRFERLPLDELVSNEVGPVEGAIFKDRDDIWVPEQRSGFRFAQKSVDPLMIFDGSAFCNFNRDRSIQKGISTKQDLAKGSFSEDRNDVVASNGIALLRVHIGTRDGH